MWNRTSWDAPFVHIECECLSEAAIEDMYFCPQCTKVLCQYCTIEEIDSFYCRNCMEHMIGSEAMNLKNRCSSCFQCPVCFSKLQICTQSSRTEKFLYLGCQKCYWDSISQGIKGSSPRDIILACQSYFTKEDPLQRHFQGLSEFYKNACKSRRRMISRSRPEGNWTIDDLQNHLQKIEITPSMRPETVPAPTVEDLLDFNYNECTNMKQRLINLAEQPAKLSEVITQPVPLLTKRSKRCRHCKRYVVKPETRPNNHSFFKMENLLVYFLPRVYIREFDDQNITLVIINHTNAVAYISFEHLLTPKHEYHINSYDPVMDMVTFEGESEDHETLLQRQKNYIVVKFRKVEDDIRLGVNWKFARVSDMKELFYYMRIKLT